MGQNELTLQEQQNLLLEMFNTDYELPPTTIKDLDPMAATPTLQGSGGKNDQISLTLGEEVIENYKQGTIGICILGIYVSQGMFAPEKEGQTEDDKEKRPVCSSLWYPQNDIGDAKGMWISDLFNDKRPASADANGVIKCSTCPYSQWGSVGEWTGKEGRGKACGSPAHLMVALTRTKMSLPLEGGRPLNLHEVIYPDPVQLHLSATSLKLLSRFAANVAGIGPTLTKARVRIPPPSLLPQTLKQECKKEGRMQWHIFDVDGGNVLAGPDVAKQVAAMANRVPDLVAGKVRIKSSPVDDPSKTDADGKPLPF